MAERDAGTGSDFVNPQDFYMHVWRILQSVEHEIRSPGYDAWARLEQGVDEEEEEEEEEEEYGLSNTLVGSPAEVFLVAYTAFEELVQSLVRDVFEVDCEDVLLSVLAICLRQTLSVSSPKCKYLMRTVADASRLPRWRKLFGAAVQRPYKHGGMLKAEQPEDSVLLVALSGLSGTIVPSTADVPRNALRLINNCCQDDDRNRELILNHNGVGRIMSLAYRRIEVDFVVPTLYNICVDNELATKQLIRWNVSSLLARARFGSMDDFQEASSSDRVLSVLLSLTDALLHEERKPLLADLLELASQSVTEDHVEPSEEDGRDDRMIDLLTQLILGPGARLAAFDTECRLAVCNTLVNLLAQKGFRKSLIRADLICSYLNMPYPARTDSSNTGPELDEDPEADANLLQCRRSILKALYAICALPEFSTAYHLHTKLVKDCIASVRKPALETTKCDIPYKSECPPLSGALVILSSLTLSEHTARSLVQEHKVHEHLSNLLQTIDDQDILYPAISLIGRLALPPPNKSTLLEYGLLSTMRRFFADDVIPTVQGEAIVAVRRLIAGSVSSLGLISADTSFRTTDDTAQDSALTAALALFRRTDDVSLKIETGRLAIEVCRLLWASADGKPEDAEHEFDAIVVAPCRQAFADAIAFVILNGAHPGARGEGWFGFAMMSIWAVGRDLIVECLTVEDMLAEVQNVVASGSGAGYQNLKLVLAKMDAVLKNAFSPHAQVVLEGAAHQVGLRRIWSE